MTATALENGLIGEVPEIVGSGELGQGTAASTSMSTLMTFDSGTDYYSFIGRFPNTGTITGFDFRTGTVSTAGATFAGELQGVSLTTGNNDGVVTPTGATGTVVVATGDDNVYKGITFGTPAVVTRGDLFALVLKVSSGTPNTVIVQGVPSNIMVLSGFPYGVQDTTDGATPVRANSIPPAWALNYSGTYKYVYGLCPIVSIAHTTIGNDNERALRFLFPVPVSIRGVKIAFANMTAGATFSVRACDANGGELLQMDFDTDTFLSNAVDAISEIIFPSDIAYAANAAGFISVHQTSASAVPITDVTTISPASHINALPGGLEFYLGTRTAAGGAGAFATNTLVRPMIHLMLGQLSDGASTGGSSRVYGS